MFDVCHLDKGKAVVDPDEIRREVEERERQRRTEENLRYWWESQRNLTFDLPVPEECFAPHPAVPLYIGGNPRHHHSPTRILNHSEASTSRAIGHLFFSTFPPIQPPLIPVATDRVSNGDMRQFWRHIPAPDRTEQEPWYRLANGFIRFRHGESWDIINREERAYASRREAARNQGIPVLEEPPPPRPDERILRVIDDDDPMEWPEENQNEPENDHEEENEAENEAENEEENEVENEDIDLPDWSDTSTITVEPTQVPPSPRNYLRGPMGYFGRRR